MCIHLAVAELLKIYKSKLKIAQHIWVKTAEVLGQDRLLGSFSVKPVLSRLKYTLLTLALSLLVCALLFINIDGAQKSSNITSETSRDRAISEVYNDDSAQSFEPDAFCGELGLP